jgi:N-acetylmuramoyl-L-alanine amidase
MEGDGRPRLSATGAMTVLELAPENYDYVTALRLIGYDTSNLKAAIVAFKRHFVQTDVKPEMTQLDLNILYNVSKKY